MLYGAVAGEGGFKSFELRTQNEVRSVDRGLDGAVYFASNRLYLGIQIKKRYAVDPIHFAVGALGAWLTKIP